MSAGGHNGPAREAVERWARRVRDRRRFHTSRRAADGKWTVWHKRRPPRHVAMEWVAVHVAETRREALGHLRKLVDAQHGDDSPSVTDPAGAKGAPSRPPGEPARRSSTCPPKPWRRGKSEGGDKPITPPPGKKGERLHT